ncbi:1762_t:CDS:1 [Paraglomus occultum]|uniref:1762_t:CDS:1 n=1 Tax=Paraglomus occultum TaxID=144539 RepID=A0A9N8Z9W9_9GLOM|nr:1762_t:CDS:1 [Paraglomus occultum]
MCSHLESNGPTSSSPTALAAIIYNFQKTLTSFECDLLRNPPYNLTISIESLLNPKRKRRRRNIRRNPSPPRPQNSWLIFRQNFESRLRLQYPDNSYSIQDVSKTAGKDWRRQPQIVKQYFDVLAKLTSQQHKHTYPDYAYRPQKKPRKPENRWLFKVINKEKFVRCENCEDIANERNIEAENDGLVSEDALHEEECSTTCCDDDACEMINLDDYDFSDDVHIDDIDDFPAFCFTI